MGNDCGELGHNAMDHHFKVGARATYDGFKDRYYSGRRPNGIYIQDLEILEVVQIEMIFRGYGYQGGGGMDGQIMLRRGLWKRIQAILKPANWSIISVVLEKFYHIMRIKCI